MPQQHSTRESGAAIFQRLDGKRQGYLARAQKYAAFTLPRLCPPDNYDENTDELSHDWHSVGAQAMNHAVNKLMLSMFAPSRPNIRLSLEPAEEAKLAQALGADNPLAVQEWLAEGEQAYVKTMDRLSVRPHIFDAVAALVGIGDALLYLPMDAPEEATTFNIRNYVIRRTPGGRIAELVVRERVMATDLSDEALTAFQRGTAHDDAEPVWMYRHIKRTGKHTLTEDTYIESTKLPEKYSAEYTDENSPWLAVPWHLARGRHYGTGLVEEYAGDFAALSSLSRATVEGALLAAEFRWLVNPNGITKVEDFMSSRNGSALPGQEGDISLVVNSKPNDLAIVDKVAESHIRRIGQGFMMNSAMTRDAERVTAVEMRMQAVELETGMGGAFTRLSSTLQRGVALFLLAATGLNINGTAVQLSVITGLDALSRSGDLDALRAALTDISQLQNLGPATAELQLGPIISAIFMGHGLAAATYVKSAEQKAAEQQQAQEAEARQIGNEAAAQAATQGTQ